MRQAVTVGALEIHYQPLVSLRTGEVTGAESLLRWRHPDIGLMVPGQFLSLAKGVGLMPAHRPLGNAAGSPPRRPVAAAGRANLRLCVNVGKTERHDCGYFELMERFLVETGLPAGVIGLEVPEALAMDNVQATLRGFKMARCLCCRIALDEFGAGRTDFRILRRTPADVLKIAGEFIRDVA